MRASRVLTFARYEIRRAVARKKVLALVALTVLIAIAPYYALDATHTSLITPPLRPYLWILGVFLPQAFFLQFTALLIAAGSMSEEYEQGTAEVLLSKPVSREEYFFGKYLGGYALVVGIVVLDVVLSITSATFVFGPQQELGIVPDDPRGPGVRGAGLLLVRVHGRRADEEVVPLLHPLRLGLLHQRGGRRVPQHTLQPDGDRRSTRWPTTTSRRPRWTPFPLLLAEPKFPSSVQLVFRFAATPVEPSIGISALLIAVYFRLRACSSRWPTSAGWTSRSASPRRPHQRRRDQKTMASPPR